MRVLIIALSAVLTVGMVLAGIWGWHHARALWLVRQADNQQVMLLAVRSGAVACVALAQLAVLVLIVGNLYRADALTGLLRRAAGLVFLVAAGSAIVLGLAGR